MKTKAIAARFPVPLQRYQMGGGIPNVFYGAPYQKGHGLGSLLGGMFRTIMPWIKSGARVLGRQALYTGGDILKDVVKGRSVSAAAKDHLIKAGHSLADQAKIKLDTLQKGSGYKKRGRKRKLQSKKNTRTKRSRLSSSARPKTKKVKRRVKKKKIVDIFA